MAYKNNLLEYYGGGSVPYRQGYQEGGYSMPSWEDYKSGVGSARLMERADEDPLGDIKLGLGAAGNIPGMAGIASDVASAGLSIGQGRFKEGLGSLASAADPTGILGGAQTGMSLWDRFRGKQYGGEVKYMQGGGLAAIARARKISGARRDVERRAQEMKKKQGKSGFWGKIGSIGGKALATAAMAALAPATGGLSLLAAKSLGSGLGSYLGAKAGYGDKVGSGLDGSKWLAGSRKQLGKAEEGLDKSFKERGLASGATTFAMGAIEGDLKGAFDKWKPDTGEVPMGGGMAPELPGGGDLSKAYAGSPEGYAGGVEAIEYDPSSSFSGFGVERKALGSQPLIGSAQGLPELFSSVLQQQDTPISDYDGLGGGMRSQRRLPSSNYDPSQYSYPQFYNPPGLPTDSRIVEQASFQQGGMARDDMALLDMIYRR